MRRSVLDPVVSSDDERDTLERWARRPKSAQALALRCRIVLACADGSYNFQVAEQLGVSSATVGKLRRRFLAQRLDGLPDEPRPGAPRMISDDAVEAVVVKTLEETPLDATHWSTWSMAKATGMSQSAVSRIWWALTSTRPTEHWSCVSTRRPRSKHSIAPHRCSRCDPDSPRGAPTTMCKAAPPTSTPPSMWLLVTSFPT
jgi:transposase